MEKAPFRVLKKTQGVPATLLQYVFAVCFFLFSVALANWLAPFMFGYLRRYTAAFGHCVADVFRNRQDAALSNLDMCDVGNGSLQQSVASSGGSARPKTSSKSGPPLF